MFYLIINFESNKSYSSSSFFFSKRVCPDHVTILTKIHEIVTSLPTHGCHGFSLIHHGNDLNQFGNFSLVLPSLVIGSSMGWGPPDVMVNISRYKFSRFCLFIKIDSKAGILTVLLKLSYKFKRF